MNPCLWLLVLQQFGALQTSILRHDTEAKGLIATMQLGELGDRKSPSVVQGKSSNMGSGNEVPQKPKLFAHNILHFRPMQQ